MMEAELTTTLGYEKHSPSGTHSGNSRNGYRHRRVAGTHGEADLAVPRDRNGDYEPKILKEYSGILNNEIEEKIISLYVRGLSIRDVAAQLGELYHVEVSDQMISNVTDRILPLLKEWQNRPLESIYPIVYLDGIRFKVRSGGKVTDKVVYTILGVTMSGKKELLGLWIAESEGAKYWLSVLTELKQRGMQDMLIVCIDGLKGFGDAIRAVFPDAIVQRCIVHQIRNTTKYIPYGDRKRVCASLRSIYAAATMEAGWDALQKAKTDWPQYAVYLASWEEHWDELSEFFQFDQVIRERIYTTNAVESLHRQFRKVTKVTTIFPHEQAVLKRIFLAQSNISKQWTSALPHWGKAMAQLKIQFGDRIQL